MSAYIVSVNTIHAMVTKAKDYGLHDWFNPEIRELKTEMERLVYLGQLLIDANVISVMARYPDADELPAEAGNYYDEPYEYVECRSGRQYKDSTPKHLEPVDLLMIVSCYKYQTCEFQEWEYSDAFRLCANRTYKLIHDCVIQGMDDAPWGIV